MIHRFPYSRHSTLTQNKLIRFRFHPFINIGLKRDSRLLNVGLGYIDTGSQWCLFDGSLARLIGIQDFKNSKYQPVPLSGIGGEGTNISYFHDVTLIVYRDTTLNSKKLKLDKAWKIETQIGFTEKSFGFGGILGVYGFLDQFIFKTNIPEGYFELEPLFDVNN